MRREMIAAVVIGVVVLSLVSWAVIVPGAATSQASLVEEVRRVTQGYHDVAAARAAGLTSVVVDSREAHTTTLTDR